MAPKPPKAGFAAAEAPNAGVLLAPKAGWLEAVAPKPPKEVCAGAVVDPNAGIDGVAPRVSAGVDAAPKAGVEAAPKAGVDAAAPNAEAEAAPNAGLDEAPKAPVDPNGWDVLEPPKAGVDSVDAPNGEVDAAGCCCPKAPIPEAAGCWPKVPPAPKAGEDCPDAAPKPKPPVAGVGVAPKAGEEPAAPNAG